MEDDKEIFITFLGYLQYWDSNQMLNIDYEVHKIFWLVYVN